MSAGVLARIVVIAASATSALQVFAEDRTEISPKENPAVEVGVPLPVVDKGFGQVDSSVIRTSAVAEAKQAIFEQRLRELEELQHEVAQLRAELGKTTQFSVRLQMLEVSLTKLRQLGVDIDMPSAFAAGGSEDASNLIDCLKLKNVAKELANPAVIVTSGRPASFFCGGELPVSAGTDAATPATSREFGTKLDLVATALENGRVRLEVRGRVSELDTLHSIVVNGVAIPALSVRQFDTVVEGVIGKPIVLNGMVEARTETVKTESGVRQENNEIALIVVITPELVRTVEKPEDAVSK